MKQSLLYWYYLTQYTFFLSGLVEQNVEQRNTYTKVKISQAFLTKGQPAGTEHISC